MMRLPSNISRFFFNVRQRILFICLLFAFVTLIGCTSQMIHPHTSQIIDCSPPGFTYIIPTMAMGYLDGCEEEARKRGFLHDEQYLYLKSQEASEAQQPTN